MKLCCKFHGNLNLFEIDAGPEGIITHFICEKCGEEWVE